MIPSARPLRTILVGFGEMGAKHHLPALERAGEDVEVAGIVRRNGATGPIGVPVFTDLSTALRELRPHLALIATPHHLHFEQTNACLEHRCHVLVEKPLALVFDQVELLVRLAHERERLLVVGLQRRYEGFALAVEELRDTGKLGEIRLVHGLFAHRFSGAMAPWRQDPCSAGVGIVDDSAYHLLDLLLHFAGGRVITSKAIISADSPVPHSFGCLFSTDTGADGIACGSYLSPANSAQEEISIFGTKGSVFGRRFCREWSPTAPLVFYKSADGNESADIDLAAYPAGRSLPLTTLLDVLHGRKPRTALLTEAAAVLETHRLIAQLRANGCSSAKREVSPGG